MPKPPKTIRFDTATWSLIEWKAGQCTPPVTPQAYIRYRLNLIAAEIYVEKEQSK